MSLKLKVLGLGILATMAMGAVAVMNATATTGGHFIFENHHTIIKGSETLGVHESELSIEGLKGIVCTTASYVGTHSAVAGSTTTTELTITPTYANCHTTGSAAVVTVHMNGCHYLFTVAPNATSENTVHLKCPAGKQVQVTHEGCTINFPAQGPLTGVTYTTTVENGVHALTVDLSVTGATAHLENGFCVLLGTKQAGKLGGSVTVRGEDTAGFPVGITATGPLG